MLQLAGMKTKHVLSVFLALMAGMVLFAVFFPAELKALLDRPALSGHALFVHVVSTTLFFGNAVVGMLWEWRSLKSGRKEVFLHTYGTVSWLDARLSAPLIVLSVLSGVTLSLILGDLWQIGWLSLGFALFLLSGLVWVLSDIPTQYRVKRLVAGLEPGDEAIPPELVRLLRLRLRISLAGVLPLAVVFALMVYKPELPPLGQWFR